MLKNKIIILFLLGILAFLWLFPSLTFSQVLVAGLEIEGNQTVEKSLILNVVGITPGTEIDATTIQDAIKRVYALGLFSDVQILGEQTPLGIQIKVVVKEYSKIKGVEFSGNKKIKRADLKGKVGLSPGRLLIPSELKNDQQRIKGLYQEKGYLLAEIETEITLADTLGEVGVKFKINEGEKVKVKKIFVQGNKAFTEGKIRGKIKTKQKSFFRSGDFDWEKFKEDKDRIVEFYKKEGYIDAEVVSDSIWYSSNLKELFIKLEISEGERYKFGSFSFAGNQVLKTERLAKQVKFKEGEIYHQEKYDQTLRDLYSAYQEESYLYARILDNTQTQGNVVNINYQISEGIPANIHLINIEGNTKTKDKVIRRELSLVPGQRFRQSLLMRSLRDVTYLNYFSNIEPDYEILDNGDIDLKIKVEEKPTGQIQFGAGYGETDKLVGTISLGIPNFMGNGQTAQLNWDFGKRRQTIQLGFTEPWFMDTPTSVGFDIYQVNRIWEDQVLNLQVDATTTPAETTYTTHTISDAYTEETKGFGLRLGRRLNWPDNYFRIYWHYRLEDVSYKDFAQDYLSGIKQYVDLSKLHWPQRNSSMDFTLTRDDRDLPQFATSGSVLSWSTDFSGSILGGSWAYHKHIFEATKYTKLLWKFVLMSKFRVGVIDGFSKNLSKIPPQEYFTPGGTYPDGIIRGYEDASLGTRGLTRSVLVYNLELQFPLVAQQVYGLLLADAGKAWAAGKDIRPFDLRRLYRSAGLGFRLVVPNIGVLGFDFAYGFDYPSGKGQWRPHFQVGAGF
jgi:outer membrane protein insertion porin family